MLRAEHDQQLGEKRLRCVECNGIKTIAVGAPTSASTGLVVPHAIHVAKQLLVSDCFTPSLFAWHHLWVALIGCSERPFGLHVWLQAANQPSACDTTPSLRFGAMRVHPLLHAFYQPTQALLRPVTTTLGLPASTAGGQVGGGHECPHDMRRALHTRLPKASTLTITIGGSVTMPMVKTPAKGPWAYLH